MVAIAMVAGKSQGIQMWAEVFNFGERDFSVRFIF